MSASVQSEVIIVGAGFGGIGAAIELQKHGIRDITVLDKAPEAGGTWFYNSYPGAACDVPSHLYSFSFAQRKDWSRLCSPQSEILSYLQGVTRDFGIDRLIVHDAPVAACEWDEDTLTWTVTTESGDTYVAPAVIIATGQLHQPLTPTLDGADTFKGHRFHSAEWDHDYDLSGKRVAVIGTGASAVQFVPEVAKVAAKLSVFQRSGNWFLARKNTPYPGPVRTAIDKVPGLQAARRRFIYHYGELLTLAIRHPNTVGRVVYVRSRTHMRRQLKDPEVRALAWPDYTFGCKRVLFSSAYLPALQRPNVELTTERVTGLTETGVKTADGRVHEVDCIIYGTGFRTTEFMFPMRVTGVQGRDLATDWATGAHAHLGISVPGYPSLFVMYGPNTNTSGGSIIVYLEAQARFIRQALQAVKQRGARAIDVLPAVENASDVALQARFAGTAWTLCDSWYKTEQGRIVANWPGYMREYEEATRTLDPAAFTFVSPARRDDGTADPEPATAGEPA